MPTEQHHSTLKYTPCRIVGRNPDHPTSRQSSLPTEQMIEPKEEKNIIGNLTTVQKDNMLIIRKMQSQPRSIMPYSIYE